MPRLPSRNGPVTDVARFQGAVLPWQRDLREIPGAAPSPYPGLPEWSPSIEELAPDPELLLYLLDLVGVAVFAISGALAAGRKGLDLLGVVVIAAITGVGGGTLRDLLLDRHPIFWILDPTYVVVILVAALATVVYVRLRPPPGPALLIADALGLALFAIAGAQIAEAQIPAGVPLAPIIVVLMGTMTGVAGGVLRDVLTAQVPVILRRDVYASAAIAGILGYLGLKALGMPPTPASLVGMGVVVGLRLLAILKGLRLPVFRLPDEPS